jgi:manganese transport protein
MPARGFPAPPAIASATPPLSTLPIVPAAPPGNVSLEDMHGSVAVPRFNAGFWRQWRAFVGPAILISVGYMDPGNWGTDLAAGAQFKYGLLWVVGLASLMAIFLQVIAARLGVVTGKDLAQCCRDWYPAWTRWPNWLFCELAIGMTDLAESLGSAVAINLLFHIPLLWAMIITAFDVLLLLALRGMGMRFIEAVVATLVATIAVSYFIEIFVIPQTHPGYLELGKAMLDPWQTFSREGVKAGMTVLAIGIVGATVMPHNLYLHSALVQTRKFQKDSQSIRTAIRFNTIDSTVALTLAFFINAAILVLAAMVFFGKDSLTVASGEVFQFNDSTDWFRVAYLTLAPLLGTAVASVLFAVALLASGQSSTITGTLAGQVVMEGFMHWRIRPWVRRVITRLLAVLPAIIIIAIRGERNSVIDLINLSQAALALQLPFAMFPLLHFASSKKRMGQWKLGKFLLVTGWGSALLITAMDIYSLPDTLKQAWAVIVGGGS